MITDVRPEGLPDSGLKPICEAHIDPDGVALIVPMAYKDQSMIYARRIESAEIVLAGTCAGEIGQAVIDAMRVSEDAIAAPGRVQLVDLPSEHAMQAVSIGSWSELKQKFHHLHFRRITTEVFGVTKWGALREDGGSLAVGSRYMIADLPMDPFRLGDDILEIVSLLREKR